MAALIQLNRVSFTYERSNTPALTDVSLALEAGSFTGIIGPSGAGKSTLASILSGAIPHHFAGALYGSACVAGMDTCEVSLTDIARVVGSVLQDIDAQMVASNVEDELLFGLENFCVPHNEIEARITDALDAVGISELKQREIATLSGGQKQKVAIAAILALRPRVLILDEPTAALDPVSARTVFEVLQRANKELGITVVVIEQAVALLSEFCDHIVVLNKGSIAVSGTPHEVFSKAQELRQIGVDTPRTVRISNSLKAPKPCLNVDEAYEFVSSLLDKTSIGKVKKSKIAQDSSLSSSSAYADSNRRDTSTQNGPLSASSSSLVSSNASSNTPSPILSITNASFAYPAGGAQVNNLKLEVYPGEIMAVVGENGAGKTTLTKLVNGLLKPHSGSVMVSGLDTRTTPVSQLAAHVATLFQNPDHQLCKNTVLEEVAFGLELQGMDSTRAQTKAQAVIDRFGLPAQASPFSLSRGERQMVALASVVVTEPELVILDEPTSGLDYRECMTVMETVRDMAQKDCAVLLVCHDMEVVSDFATRIAVMAQGSICAVGSTKEIFQNADALTQGHINPPQVLALSLRLAQSHTPAFAGISEVSELVSLVKELSPHA